MKFRINPILLFTFFIVLTFLSCQNEEVEIVNPTDQETIVANSTLSNLMGRATANYGAADDLLDGASCFSVALPVTIIIDDVTIVIATLADLQQLEDLFSELNGDEDLLDFVFPITLIFSDYTELIIENEDQLENFIGECDDAEDDVIECVDFVYPISFSVFNSDFNLIDTVTIQSDEGLYAFLEALEGNENALIVSLNYPVTLEYANGETIEVTSNEELANAIEAAGDDCDDEDDECFEEDVALNLVECPWEVFLYTNDDLENLDGPYIFNFSEDGVLTIAGITTVIHTTTWELSETDNGLELNIGAFYYYEEQYGNWLVVECDSDELEFEHLTTDGTGLFFEQACEDDLDCSLTDISSILQECPWDFTDGTDTYNNYQFVFNENGELQITEGVTTSAIGGSWDLFLSADGLLEIVISNLTAFSEDLEGSWLVLECGENGELTIIRDNAILELDQDCYDETAVFNCFGDFEIVECAGPNNVPVYNLSANTIGLVDCTAPFTPSFHATLMDAETNTNPIANTEAYGTLTAQVYLRIEAENGEFEIFTIYLNTEDCNLFECFQSFDAVLEICDEDNDGFEVFDLTNAFANCTPSADVVTYYETLIDADSSSNPIANPQYYTNGALSQLIYVRVEIDNQFEVFSIQLIVTDCSSSACSEEDVDAFLLECIWNAVNYNGSDNLAEYNFDFDIENQAVLIYSSQITIDALWSTSQSNDGVVINFSNVDGPNIQAITGEWLVVECNEERLELQRGDDILVLERTCI